VRPPLTVPARLRAGGRPRTPLCRAVALARVRRRWRCALAPCSRPCLPLPLSATGSTTGTHRSEEPPPVVVDAGDSPSSFVRWFKQKEGRASLGRRSTTAAVCTQADMPILPWPASVHTRADEPWVGLAGGVDVGDGGGTCTAGSMIVSASWRRWGIPARREGREEPWRAGSTG
jgi:hypothetical protein